MGETLGQRAGELFVRGVDIPVEEREAWLDAECGEDAPLRARVATLLRADDSMSTWTPLVEIPRTLAPGDMISDRYRISGTLGEGGFGVVFAAEQLSPVRRQVAIKLIKPGMDSHAVIQRFEVERQALARLDHPGVARIYDGGVARDGRPFFVMEFVDGRSITDHCTAHRLPLHSRLRLFVDVCDAVQHAHANGVMHRDLKPSNIIVAADDETGRGTPKIIDFGIAKALGDPLTDASVVTRDGGFVGTPAYMSPEQATGRGVDIRSDVYSLGVVLYELLTGVTPLDAERLKSASVAEVQRLIKDVDPARPSVRVASDEASQISAETWTTRRLLESALRRDLDWVIMKCLEKDADRRYGTVAEVGREIRRFLNREPLQAGPPSVRYRAAKFVRKHRTAVATGSIVAAALVGATVFSGLAAASEARQRVRAENEQQVAQAINDFLHDFLTASLPSSQGPEVTVREALDAASSQLAANDDLAARPLVTAGIHRTLGVSYRAASVPDAAEPHLEAAVALRLEHLGPETRETIQSISDLASLRQNQGVLDEAASGFREAFALAKTHLGADDPLTLMTQANLGFLLAVAGEMDEGRLLMESVRPGLERLLGPDHRDTMSNQDNLARLYSALGEFDKAEALHRATLASRERVLGPESTGVILSLNNLATVFMSVGDWERAADLLGQASSRTTAVYGPDHDETLVIRDNYGAALRSIGRFDEAIEIHRDVSARMEAKHGLAYFSTLLSLNNLAMDYVQAGDFEEAEPILRTVAETMPEIMPPNHWALGHARSQWGRALTNVGDLDQAEATLLEAHAFLAEVVGPTHQRTMMARAGLAELYDRRHDHDPDAGHDATAEAWRAPPE